MILRVTRFWLPSFNVTLVADGRAGDLPGSSPLMVNWPDRSRRAVLNRISVVRCAGSSGNTTPVASRTGVPRRSVTVPAIRVTRVVSTIKYIADIFKR